jgi:hypothetical protein
MVLSFLVLTGPQPVKQVEEFLVDVEICMSSTLQKQPTKKRLEERGRVRTPIMKKKTSRNSHSTGEIKFSQVVLSRNLFKKSVTALSRSFASLTSLVEILWSPISLLIIACWISKYKLLI